MATNDPIKKREVRKRYRQSEKGKASERRSAQKRRDCAIGKEAKKAYLTKWRNSPDGQAAARKQRVRHEALRLETLAAYGGKPPKCSCECGCTQQNTRLLTLDHVNNDGAAHRKALGMKRGLSGFHFYTHLKSLGWPNVPPLRVLCYNCNCGRQINAGICPNIRIVAPEESSRRLKSSGAVIVIPEKQYPLFGKLDDASPPPPAVSGS